MARKVGSKNKVKKVVKHDEVRVDYKKIHNGYIAEITFGEGYSEEYEEVQVFARSNAGIRRMANQLVREKLV